jgi:hypothetical protein
LCADYWQEEAPGEGVGVGVEVAWGENTPLSHPEYAKTPSNSMVYSYLLIEKSLKTILLC